MKDSTPSTYIFNTDRDAHLISEGSIITTMSDLHIGMYDRPAVAGGRKHAITEDRINDLITDSLLRSDHLVLTGDVFETVYLPPDTTLDKALHDYNIRLSQWLDVTKDTVSSLHLIAGNHDSKPELIHMLEEVSARYPDRLHIHPVALRMNDILFVHGDNVAGKHVPDAIARDADTEGGIGNNIINHLPDVIKPAAAHLFADVKSHMQPIWQLVHNHYDHKQYREDLYDYLQGSDLTKPLHQQDGTIIPEVSQIHAGHTHKPYFDEIVSSATNIHMFNAGTLADIRQFEPHHITITSHEPQVTIDEHALTIAQQNRFHLHDTAYEGVVEKKISKVLS